MTTAKSAPSQVGGVGARVVRRDGAAKVRGAFVFANDLRAPGQLWGATVRSEHAHAKIVRVDVSVARDLPGVEAVVTAADVPGTPHYGLVAKDQPVFADQQVNYVGEPIAAVAAISPLVAAEAAKRIVVEYDVGDPIVDAEEALADGARAVHPDGNILREQRVVCGRIDAPDPGDVVVEGTYDIGIQDQAFLGTEAALAVPDEDGNGITLHLATQFLHDDQEQIARCLGLDADRVRLVLSGVGGAFGGREDLSMQVHICLLARATGKPVKMEYTREESFLGHVHRHPAQIEMHHVASAEGRLKSLTARMVFNGGAYASTSIPVLGNAVTHAQGPYFVPAADIYGVVARTNTPPNGAMRGFGVVQVNFAHETQMDRIAAKCGLTPLEVRKRNALKSGDRLITGQKMRGPTPALSCLLALEAMPVPEAIATSYQPGGHCLDDVESRLARGVGYGAAFKNMMLSEGLDDSTTARATLKDGKLTLHLATTEVGQGFITVAEQIAKSVLGPDQVELLPADTSIESAGPTSASRQTWMSGGAIEAVCQDLRKQLLWSIAQKRGWPQDGLSIVNGHIIFGDDDVMSLRSATTDRTFEAKTTFRHRPTVPLDADGQGDAHVAFGFVAHRAVVDVDLDLGVVKVVDVATTQDVGKAINPLGVIGQIEGGIAQGLGLAVMEELVLEDGRPVNGNFTDYLIPTIMDCAKVTAQLIEEPEPGAPFGAKGVGETPCISIVAAVTAAIRQATGRPVTRIPVRPQDLVL